VWGGSIPANEGASPVVELFVWDDTGAASPDYSIGPIATGGGRYRLVARQTIPNTFNTSSGWLFNENDPKSFNYLNLAALEQYRLTSGGNKGSFQFRLSWPGLDNQDWTQTSDPTKSTTVTGYAAVDVRHTDNFWVGLKTDGKYALLSGSGTAGYWWYAVGGFTIYVGGIPAYNTPAPVVNLYVLDSALEKGFYRLVARQTWNGPSAFTPGKLSVNPDDPTAQNFAILDQLENYRLTSGSSQGSFQFKLRWPALGSNEWIQSSNPVQSTTVLGYKDVNVDYTAHTWSGLQTGSPYAILDGSSSGEWYYAVGSFQVWGGAIPANEGASPVVELYVWDQTGQSPDYSLGPKVPTGQYHLIARQTIPTVFNASSGWLFNENDPRSFNYLNLANLEQYRSQGKFQFRLSWPGLDNQDWTQTSDPTKSTTVTGYAAVAVKHFDNYWVGLKTDGKYALLSGSGIAGYWWYAVGGFTIFQGGIPAYNTPAPVVNLYVLATS